MCSNVKLLADCSRSVPTDRGSDLVSYKWIMWSLLLYLQLLIKSVAIQMKAAALVSCRIEHNYNFTIFRLATMLRKLPFFAICVIFSIFRKIPLSSSEALSVGKTAGKRGKREITGARGGRWEGPFLFPSQCPPRAFVSLLPSSRALYFPAPHSPDYRKSERDLCGGER